MRSSIARKILAVRQRAPPRESPMEAAPPPHPLPFILPPLNFTNGSNPGEISQHDVDPEEPAPPVIDAGQTQLQPIITQDSFSTEVGIPAALCFPPATSSQPILALPTDILQLVFDAVFASCAEGYENAVDGSTRIQFSRARLLAPFIWSSTCRLWRRFCLSTPTLWTYFCVPGLHASRWMVTREAGYISRLRRVSARWLAMLEFLLKQSAAAPLAVRLVWYPLLGPEEETWLFGGRSLHRQALVVLQPHLARVRSLWVLPRSGLWEFSYLLATGNGAVTGAAPNADQVLRCVLPALEELVVAYNVAIATPARECRIVTLNLRTAVIPASWENDVVWDGPDRRIRGPLVRLSLHEHRYEYFASHYLLYLGGCRATLQHLTLVLDAAYGPDSRCSVVGTGPLFLPQLTELAIILHHGGPKNLQIVFTILRDTPALSVVSFRDTPFAQLGDGVTALLKCVPRRVRKLNLTWWVSGAAANQTPSLDAAQTEIVKRRLTPLDSLILATCQRPQQRW